MPPRAVRVCSGMILCERTKARSTGRRFGIGSFPHLGTEDLKQRARLEITHVPFAGSGTALIALVRGDVSLLLVNLAAIESQESTGDVRIIAAAGEVRAPTRPQLPTVDESGIPRVRGLGLVRAVRAGRNARRDREQDPRRRRGGMSG